MKQGFGRLASLKESLELLKGLVNEIGDEKVRLEDALGKVLARDIRAEIDVPHFRKAAMDGFAVRAEDTFSASNVNPKVLKEDRYIEIATGSLLPEKMDSVLMVEYAEKVDGGLRIYKAIAPGENVIEVGSDIRKGTLLFKKGTILNPRYIGVLASQGIKEVLVKKKPRVAYFSTGDELLSLGEELVEGRVYDINSFTLINSLKEMGCDVLFLGVLRDDKELIKEKIKEGIEGADFVLFSGGSSLGEKDYMVEVVEELGSVLVHGIAVKPGKPLLIGEVGNKLILGLPGYPTSALSDFYILISPLLNKMLGTKKRVRKVRARLSRKIVSTIGRYEFLPVMLKREEAIPIQKGSSAITTLADADGFVEIDENTEVLQKGTEVEVILF